MVQNRHNFRIREFNNEDSHVNISSVYGRSRKIANDYTNEYDQVASASKNADLRALSLFDSAINDSSIQSPVQPRRRYRVLNSSERQITSHHRPDFVRSSSERPGEIAEHHQSKSRLRKHHDVISSYSPADSVSTQMRRIERRLDGIMDYKFPDPEYFSDLRKSLSSINNRLATHRNMIDKYSSVDMGTAVPLSERIDAKCKIIQSRR